MKNILILLLTFSCFLRGIAQDTITVNSSLPGKLFEKTAKTQQKLANDIKKQNDKLLKTMHAREEKLYKKLNAVDSIKAKKIFSGVLAKYETLEKKITDPSSLLDADNASQYVPRMDSLQTMLKFLQPLTDKKEQLGKALKSVDELKTKLSQAEDIKSFISEREESIKSLIQSYTKLPAGITKSFGKYSKEFYYYKERIKGWKESVNDPEKIEETALQVLNKIPAFKTFWQQNSEMAQMFGSPIGAVPSLVGLQTRQSIIQQLQQRFGTTGVNPQHIIQQNLSAAQGELGKLKSKVNELKEGGIGNGNAEIPDFKPNSQKNKPFLKRLELGWNLQMGSNPIQNGGSYPSTNDLAASAGYKINDRFTTGIGIAYKFGLGTGWKHISYTNEGIGLRSFIDWKISPPLKGLKTLFGNFWISGGYEGNYRTAFKNIEQLKNVSAWQQSGLIGLSKKISVNGKFFKQAKLQALWDFLSYQQIPKAKPLVFRVGYNF